MSTWEVQWSPGGTPSKVTLEELLAIFPTLDITYQPHFLSEDLSPPLHLLIASIKNRILTTGDTREKFAISEDVVSPSWTAGMSPEGLGEHRDIFEKLREKIRDKCGRNPNYALFNIYRDGRDNITWHADNMEGVQEGSSIYSLSFGAERRFQYRPYVPGYRGRTESYPVLTTVIANNALLVMGPQTNEFWCHCVPVEEGMEKERVNITFRFLKKYEGAWVVPEDGIGTANYKRLELKFNSFKKGEHPIFDNPTFLKMQPIQ
eukprot:TRINITY_DN215_c1_g1_i1.p1 TRINITY_DN215_c1_g1~~TRINITY_DN215_c1_g1_i1.p1  ORF type:complete len:262 (+),score=49.75 TRINITY_DN215_c1_g1_i1:347-1132(+)